MTADHAAPVRREGGFTFGELAFGMLLLVVAAAVLIQHLSVNYLTTNTERDRVFAYGKAQAVLAEIQGFVDRGQIDAAVDLDVLDDGVVNRPTLSIATETGGNLVAPDHVLSGNYRRNGAWLWSRRITVQPFVGLNNRNVRYVTVRIFKRDLAGNEHAAAELSAVVNSAGSAFPTTQVFDVYLFAIENIPGWWVFMDSIKPFVESMITDLETRNPGLEFRTHWITKASFGRNESYRPAFNDDVDSLQDMPHVYHYPGRMPAGNASTYYYVPDNVRARILSDGVEVNGWHADSNPHPYALADYFNHAMRYPDELALWQRRVAAIEAREAAIAAAIAAGSPPPPVLGDMSKEPTLRLFLEDLYSQPDKYRNALIINLHGELLPVPALRNFSDAARDPVNLPRVRCVTHPEELRTARNAGSPASSDALRLRMYAYNDNTQTYTGAAIMPVPMVVEVVGVDLTDTTQPARLASLCTLQNLRGGVGVGPLADTAYFPFAAAKPEGDPSLLANEMYYRAEFVDPGTAGAERFTRIYLFNTPVVSPPVGGRGLASTVQAQLYWMPYVPCPVEAARDFSTNLYTSSTVPKNTARWTLRIDGSVFTASRFVDTDGNRYDPTADVVVPVRTRIWSGADPANSGTMWPPAARNQPENLSVTYAWWADSLEDVPITERSQFQGDPRHCPYKDLFNGDPDYPNGYNWYHDTLANGAFAITNFPSINAAVLRNRWQSQMLCDVPRFFEVLRRGIVRSACVYTTLTGFSYYYIGVGNDIGYDSANGYPNSIPCNLRPHGSPGAGGFVNTIIGARRLVRAAGAGYWWGLPWLGELFPDSAAAVWQADDGAGNLRGNLPAGTAGGEYYQLQAQTVYSGSNRLAHGTTLSNHLQRTAGNGCTAMFNIGTSASTFHHVGSSGNGTMTAVGLEIAGNYNMSMPTSAPISRPFGLTWGGGTGDEFGYAPYSTNRHSATAFKTYYTHGSGIGSALVKLVAPGNTAAAYVVVNGIDKAVDSGTTFIAKWSVLTLVHSFFEAGSTTNTLRIQQLPRVEIASPTDITEIADPDQIDVQFGVSWTRWDGLPYTATGTFAEPESQLEYAVMYSDDGGTTWRHCSDRSLATPGTRPDAGHLVADAGSGSEVFAWDVPEAEFPEGSYHLRIDCFRQAAPVHYSFHRTKIFIQR
ncbi:MAG: hypothetical protein FJ265_03760 [Planctomycetes bacterium]|nr:hypothetical protein [Planctomycetota bacterium]